jgi:hypothetical protein
MWGQKWGQMIWGRASTAVPALPTGMLLLLGGLLLYVGYRMGRQKRASRLLAGMIGLGIALLPVAIVRATTVFGVLWTFTDGTVAEATQVNQNFQAVANEINNLRNQTAILTDCDFRPRVSASSTECGLSNGGTTIITPGADGALIGAVRVPQNATITSVDVWVTDNSAAANLQACLAGMADAFGSYDFATPCVTTSGSAGIQKVTITALNGGVVQGGVQADQATETFEIFIFSNDNSGNSVSWPADFSLYVRSAYVHYQLP